MMVRHEHDNSKYNICHLDILILDQKIHKIAEHWKCKIFHCLLYERQILTYPVYINWWHKHISYRVISLIFLIVIGYFSLNSWTVAEVPAIRTGSQSTGLETELAMAPKIIRYQFVCFFKAIKEDSTYLLWHGQLF